MTTSATFAFTGFESQEPRSWLHLAEPLDYIHLPSPLLPPNSILSIKSTQQKEMPFAVKALDHVVLTCRNIPATVKFYKLLGMSHERFRSSKDAPGVERYMFSPITPLTGST
jgi:hypothetical protein